MPLITITGFDGENRALQPSLLAESVGTISRNQKPGRGDFRPWKVPLTVATVPAGRGTIYRMGRDVASDSQYWLSWTGTVHAVRGFDATDTLERTYYSGDGAPKVTTNTALDGTDPQDNPTVTRPLGVPAPAAAPTITSQAVPTVADAGKYVYLLSESAIDVLVVGDILRLTVDGESAQTVTLTDPGGGSVTPTSVAAQLTALTGVSATVVAATETDPAGVRILSDAETGFTLEKKSGTIDSYDPDDVTYTAWKSGSTPAVVAATALVVGNRYVIKTLGTTDFTQVGASANTVGTSFVATAVGTGDGTVDEPSRLTLTATDIAGLTPNQRAIVEVNTNAAVAVVFPAGGGTYPPKVTASALKSALSGVPGLTATVTTSGADEQVFVETQYAGSGAALSIEFVNAGTTDRYTTIGTASVVSDGAPEILTTYYVYTFVNDWGWESSPSPVSEVNTREIEAPATIGGFSTAPSGNYNITTIRIYRTQTGSTSTEFFFLREVAYGTTSTTDDNRTLGEVLPTTTWLTPPSDLTHLTSLWNGMLAGISGNSVRFCEPYVPYAWPIEYDVVPPDSKPVGLGVFGQSLLVLTTGRPLLVAGSSPDSMDQRPLEIPQGCVSAASIVSMGSGVAWASEDGLCWFGGGGAKVLTAGVMTREDWQALVPSSITGRMYEGRYFGSYDDGSGRKGFVVDPENPKGIYFLDTGYAATHFDELRDQLYVLDGTSVKKWDAGASFLTARFRSKVFRAPRPMAWAAAEVAADAYPVTLRIDALGLSSATVSALVAARPTVYSAPTATTLRYQISVTERNPVRLPADVLTQDWQVEIEGAAAVQTVSLATSVKEIAGA